MEKTEVERIQENYLERLRFMLRRAPAEIREDAVREVQSHIEDEWRALGGDLPALHTVLQHLGHPEEYGRDLALQLMLIGGSKSRSPLTLVLAVVFWASTSLIGFIVVLCATLVFVFALGMVFVAGLRLFGIPSALLFGAENFQFQSIHTGQVSFPPAAWSPAFILLVGLLPAVIVYAGLYRFLIVWLRSRLAVRGLALVMKAPPETLQKGWERHAVLAMIAIAVLGLFSCLLSLILSDTLPVGHPGPLNLPADFFRTPLNLLALLGALVFLCSPVLALLWIARRSRS